MTPNNVGYTENSYYTPEVKNGGSNNPTTNKVLILASIAFTGIAIAALAVAAAVPGMQPLFVVGCGLGVIALACLGLSFRTGCTFVLNPFRKYRFIRVLLNNSTRENQRSARREHARSRNNNATRGRVVPNNPTRENQGPVRPRTGRVGNRKM